MIVCFFPYCTPRGLHMSYSNTSLIISVTAEDTANFLVTAIY